MGEGEVMDPLSRALLSTEAGAAQLPRMFLSTPNEHAAPLFHLLVAPDACHGPPITSVLSCAMLVLRDVSIALDGVEKGATWS
jgi:hypothetical protein